jgi:hypothetical protein
VLLPKRREQSSLEVTCGIVPGDRVPSDEQLVGVSELPDQPAAAVSYRLASAEPPELAQPATENIGLADATALLSQLVERRGCARSNGVRYR